MLGRRIVGRSCVDSKLTANGVRPCRAITLAVTTIQIPILAIRRPGDNKAAVAQRGDRRQLLIVFL